MYLNLNTKLIILSWQFLTITCAKTYMTSEESGKFINYYHTIDNSKLEGLRKIIKCSNYQEA